LNGWLGLCRPFLDLIRGVGPSYYIHAFSVINALPHVRATAPLIG
jgi:hypothetical protein